jgi:predicted outer membrane protein
VRVRNMRRYAASLALLLVLLAGCGQQSPQETLRSELQAVKSNAAIAEMVARNLARGAVPQAYAGNALESAKGNLDGSIQTLSQLPQVKGNGAQSDSLLPHLQAVQRDTESLLIAVKKGDLSNLTSLAEQLAKEEQAIDEIVKGMGLEL